MNKIMPLVLLLAARLSFAATSFPIFTTLDGNFEPRNGSTVEVTNMPPARSQDGLNICYGFSAATLYQQYSCKQSNSNCSQIADDKIVSPLGLAVYGASREFKSKSGGDSIPYSAEGGDSVLALSVLSHSVVEAESCYPFDQFIKKHQNNNREMNDAFTRLKEKYYDKNKTEGSICTDCLINELNDEFNIKTDSVSVLKALKSSTFDKFLFDIMLYNCPDLIEPISYKLNTWPEDSNGYKYEDMIAKLKPLFKSNTPVSIGGCLDKKVMAGCKSAHDFVISGYRKYCKQTPECKSDCSKNECSREALRVHNSWGQDWQDQNNDGWVDAKTLYEYVNRGKHAIGWLSPSKTTASR